MNYKNFDLEEKRLLLKQLLMEKQFQTYKEMISPEYYNFELFPEYRQLKEQIEQINTISVINPYFTIHDGVNNDKTQIKGQELINYSSYNYLGLSGHPVVSQATKDAIERYGTSVSASRLISGERPLHQELEHEIANLLGTEDAIVYVGGHSTNVTTIGHLFGEGDLILHDSLIHNCVILGATLSGSQRMSFPHNNWCPPSCRNHPRHACCHIPTGRALVPLQVHHAPPPRTTRFASPPPPRTFPDITSTPPKLVSLNLLPGLTSTRQGPARSMCTTW
jgi:hypothetical protein